MTNEDFAALTGFSGTVRLFPLPDLVLFPGAVQGLHIFEPRYREMTADALEGDRLITMVLLQPGWEADYQGNPPIHTVGCLGRIAASEKQADGRYNLQLRGLMRVRLDQEIMPATSGRLYRQARATLLPDTGLPTASTDKSLRQELEQQLAGWCAEQPDVKDALGTLLRSAMPLGGICDILSFVLPLPAQFKQVLLADTQVGARAARLLSFLEGHKPTDEPAPPRKFPPDFSSN